MKFNLVEDIHKNLEVEPSDVLEYSTQEMVISEDDLKSYIDRQYSADTVIGLAKQIYGEIPNNDLQAAYEILIDFYAESDFDDDFNTDDLRNFYNYIDDCVYEDYGEAAQEVYDDAVEEQAAANNEINEFEQDHMWSDRF